MVRMPWVEETKGSLESSANMCSRITPEDGDVGRADLLLEIDAFRRRILAEKAAVALVLFGHEAVGAALPREGTSTLAMTTLDLGLLKTQPTYRR